MIGPDHNSSFAASRGGSWKSNPMYGCVVARFGHAMWSCGVSYSFRLVRRAS